MHRCGVPFTPDVDVSAARGRGGAGDAGGCPRSRGAGCRRAAAQKRLGGLEHAHSAVHAVSQPALLPIRLPSQLVQALLTRIPDELSLLFGDRAWRSRVRPQVREDAARWRAAGCARPRCMAWLGCPCLPLCCVSPSLLFRTCIHHPHHLLAHPPPTVACLCLPAADHQQPGAGVRAPGAQAAAADGAADEGGDAAAAAVQAAGGGTMGIPCGVQRTAAASSTPRHGLAGRHGLACAQSLSIGQPIRLPPRCPAPIPPPPHPFCSPTPPLLQELSNLLWSMASMEFWHGPGAVESITQVGVPPRLPRQLPPPPTHHPGSVQRGFPDPPGACIPGIPAAPRRRTDPARALPAACACACRRHAAWPTA